MPRRGNREGTAYWNANRERWEGRLLVSGVGRLCITGRRGESKQSVMQRLHEQRDKYAGVKRPGRETLADWLARWLELYVKVAPRTRQSYEDVVNRLLVPRLGTVELVKLEPDAIVRALDTIPTAATRRYAYSVLRIALERAYRTRRVGFNAAALVDPPKVERKRVTAPSGEETRTLLASLRGHQDEALILTAITTGLRAGELCALRWQDIDPDGTVHVRGQINEQRVRVSAKRGSERLEAVGPSVLKVLRRHRLRTDERLLSRGERSEDSDPIFLDADGRQLTRFGAYQRWRAALDRAGLDARPFHATRHAANTLLIEGGMPKDAVQALMGHRDDASTRRYTHATDEMRRQAVEIMERVVG